MTIQDIIKDHDLTGKNIVIIGGPASGKTFIAGKLAEHLLDHIVIHTDDYMEHGFEQSLYVMIEDIKENDTGGPLLIEGVLGYRLLRKGVELNCFYPDVVIELEITDERLEQVYMEERDPDKLKGARSQVKALNTILAKYQAMDIPEDKKPEWIKIQHHHALIS